MQLVQHLQVWFPNCSINIKPILLKHTGFMISLEHFYRTNCSTSLTKNWICSVLALQTKLKFNFVKCKWWILSLSRLIRLVSSDLHKPPPHTRTHTRSRAHRHTHARAHTHTFFGLEGLQCILDELVPTDFLLSQYMLCYACRKYKWTILNKL